MIIAAEVKRDEQGYWTHPALARSGCETSAELSYWLRTHKLQCFVMTMRDEAPEAGNDSNLLIVFYVQIMPDDLVMQLHRF